MNSDPFRVPVDCVRWPVWRVLLVVDTLVVESVVKRLPVELNDVVTDELLLNRDINAVDELFIVEEEGTELVAATDVPVLEDKEVGTFVVEFVIEKGADSVEVVVFIRVAEEGADVEGVVIEMTLTLLGMLDVDIIDDEAGVVELARDKLEVGLLLDGPGAALVKADVVFRYSVDDDGDEFDETDGICAVEPPDEVIE